MSRRAKISWCRQLRFPRVIGDEPPRAGELRGLWCFPRVSGDEPTVDETSPDAQQFSPRERG